MSRDDLIEALALAMAARQKHGEEWLRTQPTLFAMVKRDAAACYPVIVDVVATWIANQSGVNVVAEDAEYMVKAWREEMA